MPRGSGGLESGLGSRQSREHCGFLENEGEGDGWLLTEKLKIALTRNGPRDQNPTNSIGWATLERHESFENMLDTCYHRFVRPFSPLLSHCR